MSTLIKTALTAILFLSLGTGCALLQPGPTETVLPKGTLDAAAITKLFAGKTLESVDRKGQNILTYYNPDGTLRQKQKDLPQKTDGTWNVREDGRLCQQVGDARNKCRIIVKEGDSYLMYVVKRDNDHKLSLTYKSIRSGNQVDK